MPLRCTSPCNEGEVAKRATRNGREMPKQGEHRLSETRDVAVRLSAASVICRFLSTRFLVKCLETGWRPLLPGWVSCTRCTRRCYWAGTAARWWGGWAPVCCSLALAGFTFGGPERASGSLPLASGATRADFGSTVTSTGCWESGSGLSSCSLPSRVFHSDFQLSSVWSQQTHLAQKAYRVASAKLKRSTHPTVQYRCVLPISSRRQKKFLARRR